MSDPLSAETMSKLAWETRFKTRIVETLLKPLTEDEKRTAIEADSDWEPWDRPTAEAAAQTELENMDPSYYQDGPEEAADDCLSAWSD